MTRSILAATAASLALLPGVSGAGAGRPAPPPAADSPRASISAYLDLCRAGRYEEAGRYLAVPDTRAARAAELARRLKAVLDRHVWFDLEQLSPEPEGRRDDGLAPDTEDVGRVSSPGGRGEPVRLRRSAADRIWQFGPSTVDRVDAWYDALDDRWIRERLPEVLLRPGPRELLYWQWLALPLLLFLSWALAHPLARATGAVLTRLVAKTATDHDDTLLPRLDGPIVLAWSLVMAALFLPYLALYAPAHAFVQAVLSTLALGALFWALWRSVDVIGRILEVASWVEESATARALLALALRGGKVVVLALGVVSVLSALGYPVAGLLAGLGVGGLALALAFQKTGEHLFGSIALAIDQPFRVGDFVKVEEFVGTVETIGLRSTRFRTLDRTLIAIPNGRLADMRLESFTARDRMRLACTVGLVYGTTAAQMREVLEGLERALRAHPKIWPDAVVVRFKELGASSLDVEVMAWFQTPDWSEFQLIRQEILLKFMEVVERAGTSFAFPTRTVHLVGGAPAE
jgi:MscS family membrane protein